MAIKPVLQYRNPDSTSDLNSSQAKIIDRAIFDGGSLTLSGTSLQVTVDPFVIAGYDGMVAVSDSSETVSVPALGTYYLILHLEYRTLTAALANLQVVPETTWLTSVSKNFFVTFAKFTMPGAVTAMTDPGVVVDYSMGDWADKLGKTGWRSPVASSAALPMEGNRDGDTRLTLDTYTSYAWQSGLGAWTVVGGALGLGEAVARAHEMDAEELRAFNGSGYVGSLNTDSSGKTHNGTYGRIPYIEVASANRIDLDAMHHVVNGHFVKTPYTALTLSAPPAGERHDLIYLDVWRETVAVPSAETYPNDAATGGTSSFSTLRDRLEQLLEDSPFPNSGFSKIEAVDPTTFVVTRWVIRSVATVPAGSVSDTTLAAPFATNVDSATYGTSSPSDARVWTASSATPFDGGTPGTSWAIPLLIVRRTHLETGPFITETRSDTNDQRFIFDVAPRAELGHGLTEVVSSVSASRNSLASYPSGFISGADTPLSAPGGGVIGVPEFSVVVHGSEISGVGASVSLSLSTIPPFPVAGSPNLDLIVMEVFETANPPALSFFASAPTISRVSSLGVHATQSWGKFIAHALTTVDLRSPSAFSDEEQVMVAAGYTASTTDPGLWYRSSILGAEDPKFVYAIPVALVNRRTSGAWDPDNAVGRNNADRSAFPGLPNNPVDQPYDSEILDLRHRISRTEDASRISSESYDLLLKGDLRTKFSSDRTTLGGAALYGTQLLQVDEIVGGSVAAGAGSFQITPAPDYHNSTWSEADEAQLLSWTFTNPTSNQTSSSGIFAWANVGGSVGDLTITAPAGMHLDFGQGTGNLPASPNDAFLTISIPSSGTLTDRELYRYKIVSGGVSELSFDADGNVTSVKISTIDVDSGFSFGSLPGAVVNLQVWAVKPSRLASTYSTNYSLFAKPDIVHRAEVISGGGTQRVNIGPILKTVRVPLAGLVATVTQADINSAAPEIGSQPSISLYGAASVALVGEPLLDGSNVTRLRYVRLTDGGGSPGSAEMELEFTSVGAATEVDVQVMCDGDIISSWIEVNQAAKGVSGLYSWHNSIVTSASAAANSVAVSLPGYMSSVPFSEVGISPYGIGATAAPANFLSSSSFLPGGLHYLCVYSLEAASYTLWTSPSDLSSLVLDNASTFVANTFNTTGEILGPYAASQGVYFSAGNSGNSVLLVGVVRTPLTPSQNLKVFYTYTPYQGLSVETSAADMTSYLHGTVEEVGPSLVTTNGPNTPKIHPREISALGFSSVPYVRETYIPSLLGSLPDIGFPGSSGIVFEPTRALTSTGLVRPDFEDIRYRSTDRLSSSSISHLPSFSSDFSSASYPGELALRNTYIDVDVGSQPSFRPIPLSAAFPDPGWDFSASLLWQSSAVAGSYTLSFPLPFPHLPGFLTNLWVEASSASLDTITVEVYKKALEASSSLEFSVNVTLSPFASTVYNIPVDNLQLDEGAEYFVSITTTVTASPTFFSSLALRVSPPVTSLLDVEGAEGTGIIHHLGASPSPLRPGMVISSPFSSGDTSLLLSAYTQEGRSDYSNSVFRGRQFRSKATVSDTPLFESQSFLPGSSRSGRNAVLYNGDNVGSYLGSAMPPLVSVSSPVFGNYSSTRNKYRGAIAVLDSWIIRTADERAILGASSGIVSFSERHGVARSGNTVDAFYPVGRPLFRKKK